MDTTRRLGRSVPGDVSVVGYDDMPLAAHSTPALTTVRQDIQAGGALLAERLLQQLAGKKAKSVRPADPARDPRVLRRGLDRPTDRGPIDIDIPAAPHYL